MRKQILNRSFEWVRTHPTASHLDVPDELMDHWVIKADDSEETEPNSLPLTVFTFGYLQHQLLTSNLPADVPRSVPVTELLEMFNQWQLKLALTEIHRKTHFQVEPLQLFGFSEGETVTIYPRRLDADTESIHGSNPIEGSPAIVPSSAGI